MKATLPSLALWAIVQALTIAMVVGLEATAAEVETECSDALVPDKANFVTIELVCNDNQTLEIQQIYDTSGRTTVTFLTYVCTINGTQIGTGSRSFFAKQETVTTGTVLSAGAFCEIVQGCYEDDDTYELYHFKQSNCTVPLPEPPAAPTSSSLVIGHSSSLPLTETPTSTPIVSPTTPSTDDGSITPTPSQTVMATTPAAGPPKNENPTSTPVVNPTTPSTDDGEILPGSTLPQTMAATPTPKNGIVIPLVVSIIVVLLAAIIIAGSLFLCYIIKKSMNRNKYTCHYLEYGVEFKTGIDFEFAPVEIAPHMLPAESIISIIHAMDVKDVEMEVEGVKTIHKSASINLKESDNYPLLENDKAMTTGSEIFSGRSSPVSQNMAEAVGVEEASVADGEANNTLKAETREKPMSMSAGFPQGPEDVPIIDTSDGNETNRKHAPSTAMLNSTKSSGYVSEQQLPVPQVNSNGYTTDTTLAHDVTSAGPCVTVASSGGGYVEALEQDGGHRCQRLETDFRAFCNEELSEEVDIRGERENTIADPVQLSSPSAFTPILSHSPLRQTNSGYVKEVLPVDTSDQSYRTEEALPITTVSNIPPQPRTGSGSQLKTQACVIQNSIVVNSCSGYLPHPNTELQPIDEEVDLPLPPIVEDDCKTQSLQVQRDAYSMQDHLNQCTGSGYLQDPFSSPQAASLPSGDSDLLLIPEANEPHVIGLGASATSGYVQETPTSYQQDPSPRQPLPCLQDPFSSPQAASLPSGGIDLLLTPDANESQVISMGASASSGYVQEAPNSYQQDAFSPGHPFLSSQAASLLPGDIDFLPTPVNKPQVIDMGAPASGYVQETPTFYQQDTFPGQPLPLVSSNTSGTLSQHFSEESSDITLTSGPPSSNQIPSLDDHIPEVTSSYVQIPLENPNTPAFNRQGTYIQSSNSCKSSMEGEKRDMISDCPPQTLSPPECVSSLSNNSGYQQAPSFTSKCSTEHELSTVQCESEHGTRIETERDSTWEIVEVFSLSSSSGSLDSLPRLGEDDDQQYQDQLQLPNAVATGNSGQTPLNSGTVHTSDVLLHQTSEYRPAPDLPQAGRENENSEGSGYVSIPQLASSHNTNEHHLPKNAGTGLYVSGHHSKQVAPKHLVLTRFDSGYSIGDSTITSPSVSSSNYSAYLSALTPTHKSRRSMSLTSDDSGCSAASASDSANVTVPLHLCATSNGYYKC